MRTNTPFVTISILATLLLVGPISCKKQPAPEAPDVGLGTSASESAGGTWESVPVLEVNPIEQKVREMLKRVREASQVPGMPDGFELPGFYGDDIAGLYYLYDYKFPDKDAKGPARKKIPIEAAHSDPDGAERFGYTAKPFNGYHFRFVPNFKQEGKVEENPPRTDQSFFWEKGSSSTVRSRRASRANPHPTAGRDGSEII